MHHSTISCMDQEPHFLAQHKVIESRNSAATVQAVCELWPNLHRKVPGTLLLGPPLPEDDPPHRLDNRSTDNIANDGTGPTMRGRPENACPIGRPTVHALAGTSDRT